MIDSSNLWNVLLAVCPYQVHPAALITIHPNRSYTRVTKVYDVFDIRQRRS